MTLLQARLDDFLEEQQDGNENGREDDTVDVRTANVLKHDHPGLLVVKVKKEKEKQTN